MRRMERVRLRDWADMIGLEEGNAHIGVDFSRVPTDVKRTVYARSPKFTVTVTGTYTAILNGRAEGILADKIE